MSVSENKNPSLLVWHVKDVAQKPYMGGKCGFEPQLQYYCVTWDNYLTFLSFSFFIQKNWDGDNRTESNINYQVVNLVYYPVDSNPLPEHRAGFFFFILTLI